jgi:YbbR domain-containing protein
MERLRDLFLKNWGNKLLALVFSAALWFLIAGEKTEEVIILATVKPKGAVTAYRPSEVEVRIAGPKALADSVSPSSVTVEPDFGGRGAGDVIYTLSAQDVRLPEGFTVVKIRPSVIEVTLGESR